MFEFVLPGTDRGKTVIFGRSSHVDCADSSCAEAVRNRSGLTGPGGLRMTTTVHDFCRSNGLYTGACWALQPARHAGMVVTRTSRLIPEPDETIRAPLHASGRMVTIGSGPGWSNSHQLRRGCTT